MMKKLMNDASTYVDDMLEGIVAAHPSLKRLPGTQVIVRANLTDNKVGLISGGGSGHEPAHAGYVGYGMLDAAVAGEVFTSPTPDQILEAIRAVNRGKGVLLIVKNYTGDVMNFGVISAIGKSASRCQFVQHIPARNSGLPTQRAAAGRLFRCWYARHGELYVRLYLFT